jgi:putative endonuclease
VAAISSRDRSAYRTCLPGTRPRENESRAASMSEYSLYLVECRDGSLYTGIATDVSRRIEEHAQGAKGAKYLRGKGPLKLVYQQAIGDRSLASKVESRIKRLSKIQKSDVGRLPGLIASLIQELNVTSKER